MGIDSSLFLSGGNRIDRLIVRENSDLLLEVEYEDDRGSHKTF
jgi:hypothetical protein